MNDLTQTYGKLPAISSAERPDAAGLRSNISKHMDLALNARESAYAEALRLFEYSIGSWQASSSPVSIAPAWQLRPDLTQHICVLQQST